MLFRLIALASVGLAVATADTGANRLRKDVHYLASDKLKGRGQGTAELERASEFIARRFWKLGLKPVSAGGWFQAVPVRAVITKSMDLRIDAGGRSFALTPETAPPYTAAPVELASAPIVKLDSEYMKKLGPGELDGKVVVTTETRGTRSTSAGRPLLTIVGSERIAQMADKMPALVPVSKYDEERKSSAMLIAVDPELRKWIESLPPGPVAGATASGALVAETREFELRNVLGILRGSDPVLRDTYVIVSAHYDHLGEAGRGADRIKNGANDNASGTAAMLAVARQISKLKQRPKRSIIFAAWSGEEAGGLGSSFYARNPLVPLSKTVANINLEQVGRYDGEGGAGARRLFMTGYSYSDVGKWASEAASPTGVEVFAGPNEFFSRSDNYFLARAGVPAHTLGASLEFPDYHTAADSAEKLDYENMAQLTEAITAAVVAIANREQAPQWNPSEPVVAPYRELRSKQAAGH